MPEVDALSKVDFIAMHPPETMPSLKPAGISVNILVKNCAKELTECIGSLAEFLDESAGDELVVLDTGSTDDTPDVAEVLGAIVHRRPDLSCQEDLWSAKEDLPQFYEKYKDDPQFKGGILRDFAEARNILAGLSKNDLIFWIDSDDVLTGAKALRDYARKHFQNPAHTILFLPYDYAHDEEDGKCINILWRERIVRKSICQWRGGCHETLIPRDGCQVGLTKIPDPAIRIVHKNSRSYELSDVRNYAIMLNHYRGATWKDPRLEFYMGNACRGLRLWGLSSRWFATALRRSGSKDDRYMASLNIAQNLIAQGRHWSAIDVLFSATKIKTDDPRAYLLIGQCYHECKKYREALTWISIGRQFPPPQTMLAVDPNSYDFIPSAYEAKCFQKLGNMDGALAAVEELTKLRPDHPVTKKLTQEIKDWAEGEKIRQVVTSTCGLCFSDKAAQEVVLRLRAELRRKFRDFHVEKDCHSEKAIAFVCPGGAPEAWDASSLESGTGGSEKMVVYMSRGLVARGWKVDVYGNPKEEHLYEHMDGVCYRPFQAFNALLKRDIVVYWRAPQLLDLPVRARKLYMDMHDVIPASAFSDLRVRKLTKAIWKSDYHRSLVPELDESKCMVSRNGIDLSLFEEKVERQPFKIVWGSSPNRGIHQALKAFRLVKQEFPEASFHVFYGFTDLYRQAAAEREYEQMGDYGCERHMFDYMEEAYDLMEDVGAIFHGRVGSTEMAKHLKSASVWLYPSKFPEIACCVAMEAQAAGAIPVCSGTAALRETVTWGHIVDPDDMDAIVTGVRNVFSKGAELDQYRLDMQAEAQKRFNLKDLADAWDKEFRE